MRLPKKKGLFVTGTDTGVGKTLVSGAIAHVLSAKGIRVGVFKPIATGCRLERCRLISEDARFLAKCANFEFPICKINPVSYSTPAAPILSARMEKRPVNYSKIEDAYKQICEVCDFVIVEGIGGIRVPISKNVDVLEIAEQFALPVIVAARPNLGTINHTLLTVDCIRQRGLEFFGVVISGTRPESDACEQTAPEIISSFANIKILAAVPFDPESSVEQGNLGQAIIDSVEAIDFTSILI